MERTTYFIRRLLLVIPTFLGITLMCYGLVQVVPGGPVEQIIMQMKGINAGEGKMAAGASGTITAEQRKALEASGQAAPAPAPAPAAAPK